MKKLLSLLISVLIYLPLESKELENCKFKNEKGTPCLTIFSAPNTSKITEGSLGKTVITKKQMIDSGYKDVRSVLPGDITITGISFANKFVKFKNIIKRKK